MEQIEYVVMLVVMAVIVIVVVIVLAHDCYHLYNFDIVMAL